MRRHTFLKVFFCSTAVLCLAAAKSPRNDEQKKDWQIKKPMMWRVEKRGQVSFLFGTVHHYPDACNNVHPDVFKQLRSSKVLYVEDEGTATIKDQDLSPLMIDACLIKVARANAIPVKGMERAQTAVYAVRRAKLAKEMSEKDLEDEAWRIIGCYQSAQLLCIENTLRLGSQRANYDSLIMKRNKKWVQNIIAALDEGRAFIGAGIGHYTGTAALQELLPPYGYQVTPY